MSRRKEKQKRKKEEIIMSKFNKAEEVRLINKWYSIKKMGGKIKEWLDAELIKEYCPHFFSPDDLVSFKDGEDGRKKITTFEYGLECRGCSEEEAYRMAQKLTPIFNEPKLISMLF